jgi:hypothetical protein
LRNSALRLSLAAISAACSPIASDERSPCFQAALGQRFQVRSGSFCENWGEPL